VEAPNDSARKVEQEGSHVMMPPGQPKVAEGPSPPPKGDAVAAPEGEKAPASAEDAVVAPEAVEVEEAPQDDATAVMMMQVEQELANVEVEKIVLKDMLGILQGAVPLVTKASKIMGVIIGAATFIELTLNALIMAFKNIPSLDFLEEWIAVFASINAVQKGLMMKLDLDVRRKTAQGAEAKMKSLLQSAQQESLKLEATGTFDKHVLKQVKKDFQGIVEQYAKFLPH
jgi:hypothetical protein